jgi:beta-lactamase class D
VLGEELSVRVPTDMRSINADLRQINRTLEQRLKIALSEQAAMLNRMHKLELEYNDKVDEIARVKARANRDPHEIVGLHVVSSKGKN